MPGAPASCPECGTLFGAEAIEAHAQQAKLLAVAPNYRQMLWIYFGAGIAACSLCTALLFPRTLELSVVALILCGLVPGITYCFGELIASRRLPHERAVSIAIWQRAFVFMHIPWLVIPIYILFLVICSIPAHLTGGVNSSLSSGLGSFAMILFITWIVLSLAFPIRWVLYRGELFQRTGLRHDPPLLTILLAAISFLASIALGLAGGIAGTIGVLDRLG